MSVFTIFYWIANLMSVFTIFYWIVAFREHFSLVFQSDFSWCKDNILLLNLQII